MAEIISKKELPVELIHCDAYINSPNHPLCLRWFLVFKRAPAVDQTIMREVGIKEPVLFAKHNGKDVRVTMASRLGDVGITRDLDREYGYDLRVEVADLTDFRGEL
jgi:hypothetical protein